MTYKNVAICKCGNTKLKVYMNDMGQVRKLECPKCKTVGYTRKLKTKEESQ